MFREGDIVGIITERSAGRRVASGTGEVLSVAYEKMKACSIRVKYIVTNETNTVGTRGVSSLKAAALVPQKCRSHTGVSPSVMPEVEQKCRVRQDDILEELDVARAREDAQRRKAKTLRSKRSDDVEKRRISEAAARDAAKRANVFLEAQRDAESRAAHLGGGN